MHVDTEDGFDLRLTEVGDELPTASLGPLRIEHFCRYMFACGVPGPERDGGDVHYDMWAAARAGFNDVFDMGAWRTALFVELAENQWGGPHTRVTRIRNRYGGMVYRDDTLRFCGRVTAKGDRTRRFAGRRRRHLERHRFRSPGHHRRDDHPSPPSRLSPLGPPAI